MTHHEPHLRGRLHITATNESNEESLEPRVAEFLLTEYREAGHLHRLHITLVFGQVTVYFGLTAGLLHQLTNSPPLPRETEIVFSVAGILIASLFWILHDRQYSYSLKARNRAEAIQSTILPSGTVGLYGFAPLANGGGSWGPIRNHLRAGTATKLLYFIGGIFWLLILLDVLSLGGIVPGGTGI